MRNHIRWVGLSLALCLLGAGGVLAQGVQTATIVGTVTDAEGAAVAGVTVTARSPALQGERTTTTTSRGEYHLPGLPPGDYTVQFSIEGMQTLEVTAAAPLGFQTRVDGQLQVAAVEETVVVTGESSPALETTVVGATFTAKTIGKIPVTRNPDAIAALAGGVNNSATPVAGQVQINGGMAYDNSVLVNGINIQDPIFGQLGAANRLFIEDSISETQVLTSGISAEYGQFTGGVVNVITKSGGNDFAGSFRADYSKPEWRDETPFEDERDIKREGKTGEYYQATLGGRIVRDRLWFFLAGRDQEAENLIPLQQTGQLVPQIETNERYEVKLTGNVGANHTLQASYSDNPTERSHELQVTPIELASVARDSKRENDGFAFSYNGVFTQQLFAEARYSEKTFTFVNIGGTNRNIQGSPMRTRRLLPGIPAPAGVTYHHPYFDSTDPEDRNNEQLAGSMSYFLSSETLGSHELKLGAERFSVIRTGGNSQSSTGFVFLTDYKIVGGRPALDANGQLIPVFTSSPVGGTAFTQLQNWIPTRGSELDITTDSYFLNDVWNLNDHWSFQLGVRHEQVRSEATGDVVGVDTDTTTPRLGLSFDPRGDGKFKFDATYAEYGGRYNPSIIGTNSVVGNPSLITYQYVGPTGEGIGFAPAFDLNNYAVVGVNVPNRNIFFEDGLSAPVNEEFSFSAGMALPRGGYLKATYVDRELTGMIDNFITFDLGCTQVVLAGRSLCADNAEYRNTDGPERKYQGVNLQGRHNILDNWRLEGSWTYQLENEGNYEGEGGQSIGATIFGNRPEVLVERNNPIGRLDDYQEHKVRLWTSYDWDLGRAGNLATGLVYRYDSPLTFSYSVDGVPLSAIQRARQPAYRQPATSQTLFFGERGRGEYNSTSIFDVAATYEIPVWKRVAPWLKFEVFNVFNDDTLRTFSTTIRTDPASPLDSDGLPTGLIQDATFGRAAAATSYVTPREYLVAVGIRF